MEHSFLGIAQNLCGLNRTCVASGSRTFADILPRGGLLVIPPATGAYNDRKECWRAQSSSLFTIREIEAIVDFVQAGGRLLAFSYRFGDSFTQTNLSHLFAALGCLLNDDAVVDLQRLRRAHALESTFETGREHLPVAWAAQQVGAVQWRSMATFDLVPGAPVRVLALSPGGACISFNRTHREIIFQSRPIAVAGTHGRGRFALFGGPHVFETGTFGLLHLSDNTRFLQNTADWLLSEAPLQECSSDSQFPSPEESDRLQRQAQELWKDLACVTRQNQSDSAVKPVERRFRETGILKALNRANWAA